MVGVVKRYICDACQREECVGEDEQISSWVKTEDWDLCPSCARAWADHKDSFIKQMRKANNKSII